MRTLSVQDDPGRRTVLVTGAAGFIGSALCGHLRSLGHRVVGYDNLSRGRREYLPQDVSLVEGDVRDGPRIREAIRESKPEWLIHLAAMHFIPDCVAHPRDTMDVNVEGTRRVLEGCRGSSVRHVLFASTAAVYAPTDGPCLEDSTPLRPLEVYGESKLLAEELVHDFQAQTGISTTILRLFNAIGRNETNPHVLPHILESLQTSDVIHLGNIAPRRDYVDTRDIAEAVTALADVSSGFGVFNVGTGAAYSVRDVVDVLSGILGRAIPVVQDPSRVRTTERMLLVADLEKIRRVADWSPHLSLEDTLKDLAAAYGLRARQTQ